MCHRARVLGPAGSGLSARGSRGPGPPCGRVAARVAVPRAKADQTHSGPTSRTSADLKVPDRSVDTTQAAPPALDRPARVSAAREPKVVWAGSVPAVARAGKGSRANGRVASPGPAGAARDPAGSPGRDRAVSGRTARAAISKGECPIERAAPREAPDASGRPATRGRRGRSVNSVPRAVDRGPASARAPDSARAHVSAARLMVSSRVSVTIARAGPPDGRVLGPNTGASGHEAKTSHHATKRPHPATSPLSRGPVAPSVARAASPARGRVASPARAGALLPGRALDSARAAVSHLARVLSPRATRMQSRPTLRKWEMPVRGTGRPPRTMPRPRTQVRCPKPVRHRAPARAPARPDRGRSDHHPGPTTAPARVGLSMAAALGPAESPRPGPDRR